MKNKLFKTFLCIIMLLFLYSTSITDVIVIDPGHGGVAPGAPAINDGDTLCWEKDINMEVGWALYDTLFSVGGFEYHFTRFTDSTVANWRRALFADTVGADIFVSIHHNSTVQANHEIQGTEVYHNCDSLTDTSFSDPYGGVPRQPWESFILKKKVYYKLLDAFQYTSRCITQIPYDMCSSVTCVKNYNTVLWNTVMPSCLTEASFISNWDEASLFCDYFIGDHKREEAGAIYQGLSSYSWGQGFGRVEYHYINEPSDSEVRIVYVDGQPYGVPYERTWALGENHELEAAISFEYNGYDYNFHHWAEVNYSTQEVIWEWLTYMNTIFVAPLVAWDGYHYYKAYFTGGLYITLMDPSSQIIEIQQNDTFTIRWDTSPGVAQTCSLYIDLSIDGGNNWSPITGPIPYNNNFRNVGTYNWLVPDITSSNCYLRLIAFDIVDNYDTLISHQFTINNNCCVGIRGNIDGDPLEVVDIADIVYFIDYSFNLPPGPAPPCIEEADVNADGSVDISDVVYLIDYSFNSPPGPTPLGC